jgi:phosphomannomutase/phosphoglucomutase
MIKSKVRCKEGQNIIGKLGQAFRKDLTDHTDGLKISRGPMWALIRASGTEPLIRIIVESDDAITADSLYHELMGVISKILPE